MQHQDEQKTALLPTEKTPQEQKQTNQNQTKSQMTPTDTPPAQIVHKIQYGDTLQGLSLQYSVPIGKIRYRNHIEGDSIYHLKEIIIPNPMTMPVSKQTTESLLIEQFVGHMDYSSAKVAKYYLLQADWNVQLALKEYKQDLEWQRKSRQKVMNQSLQGNMIEMKQIKRFYGKMELLQKKKQ